MRSEQRVSRRLARQAGLVVLATIVGAVALLAAGLLWTAREQDRVEHARERELAKGAITSKVLYFEQLITAWSYWDDAVVRLCGVVDTAWADEFMRSANPDGITADLVLVVRADGRVQYASLDGRATTVADGALLRGFEPLVAAASAQLGQVVSGFGLLDGVPAVIVAAAVEPHSAAARLPDGPRTVLVFAYRLLPERVREAGLTYLVADLRPTGPSDAGDGGVPLLDAQGRGVASLGWTPRRPGSELRVRLLPPLAALAVILAAGAAALLSHLRRQEALLQASEKRATHDALTGLPNRALFADRLGVALARTARTGEPAALLYLDLDGFKPVNDRLGHAAGDEVLREVAARLTAVVRGADTVARLGGDEFAVVTHPVGGLSAVEALAGRLIREISRPIDCGGHAVRVAASVGVALAPRDGDDASTLLARADEALYAAKQGGKGRYRVAAPVPANGTSHVEAAAVRVVG